jgi:hypothetical protein
MLVRRGRTECRSVYNLIFFNMLPHILSARFIMITPLVVPTPHPPLLSRLILVFMNPLINGGRPYNCLRRRTCLVFLQVTISVRPAKTPGIWKRWELGSSGEENRISGVDRNLISIISRRAYSGTKMRSLLAFRDRHEIVVRPLVSQLQLFPRESPTYNSFYHSHCTLVGFSCIL